MNQLLSFNISSLETLREEDTEKYNEVFSTDTLDGDGDVTFSDEDTDLEDN